MPTRIKALGRVLGPSSLATVAYGEVASSLYFALGIVALYALGLTPWVLLAVGSLFLVLAVLGLAILASRRGLGAGVHLGVAPTWSSIAFALPVAMLAYTGLETVANLAAETREPGKSLPRGLFLGIGAAVTVSVVIAIVGISAFPGHPDPHGPGGYANDLGGRWLT